MNKFNTRLARREDSRTINRHNKRRHGGKDENSSQESSITTRQPTFLEKLLSAEIKRDKSQLSQVFFFIVMNSFFKESPEQPLKLPLVMVKETGCEHDREEDPTSEVLPDDGNCDDDNSCDEASDF
ncbi:hypothetical protein N665_0730s0003 [Sinapis alba]|nr:hypothetical protein N665_0730s0003 [Sinapis alba]